MNTEKIFGLNERMTILIITTSTIFAMAMIIKIMTPGEKKHWQIIHNGEYHLTSDPVSNGNCVDFTDEQGQSKTICGDFKMKRI